MEISSSSDNLSEDNSNRNNSSENNDNDNPNCANNGNNETVIVDVNEVNAEMTPVVTSTSVEQPDVHMSSPPFSSGSGCSNALRTPFPLLAWKGFATSGRRRLDNIVRKEAPKAQQPPRAAKGAP